MLQDHGDEVWYLKFSHRGTRLASGGRDGQIIVWQLSVSQLLSMEAFLYLTNLANLVFHFI